MFYFEGVFSEKDKKFIENNYNIKPEWNDDYNWTRIKITNKNDIFQKQFIQFLQRKYNDFQAERAIEKVDFDDSKIELDISFKKAFFNK